MSSPRPTESSIGVVPFIIFVLILFVPFLNFELTYYHMTLKLFVFQTAVVVLGGYLLWEWVAGRLRGAAWPAYWLFAPAALWVAWGALTSLWSRQGWLAAGWVVQGLWGLAGALGLAVLLRERATRHVFVAGASAVTLTLGLFMAALYGDLRATFFGDTDLVGREVAAAFLLVPTLLAAAVLYGHGEKEEETDYKQVLWLALLLLVFVGAGLRTLSSAWVFGLGAGLAVAIWLMLPRWRLAAAGLVVLVVVFTARWEVRVRQATADVLLAGRQAESGLLSALEREALSGGASAEGTLNLAEEISRHLERLASPQAYFGLFDGVEWGIVRRGGLRQVLLGSGAGTFLLHLDRGRTPATYATPRGNIVETHARRHATEVLCERGVVGLALAAAMGLACVAAGAMALRRATSRLDASLGAGLAAGVVALGVFACLSNGTAGFGSGMAFWVALGLLGALSVTTGREAALGLSAEEEVASREERPVASPSRPVLALGVGLVLLATWGFLGLRPFLAEWYLQEGEREYQASLRLGADASFVRRAKTYLGRAGSWGLGDRVWLNSQIILAKCELEQRLYTDSAERMEQIEKLSGPAFDLDYFLGRCYGGLGQAAKASECYARYVRRDPFAVWSPLYHMRRNCYGYWLHLIEGERNKDGPRWAQWARDLQKAATAGLEVDPCRYILLMYRGKLYSQFGEPDDARADMRRAAAILRALRVLAKEHPPEVQANLLVDLAQACIFFDRAASLEALNQIRTLPIDFSDPRHASLLKDKISPILKQLRGLGGSPEKPGRGGPSGPGAPDGDATPMRP